MDRRTRAVEEDQEMSTCDLEVMSQSLILPPTDRPYFLLLQGYDQSKARLVSMLSQYHTLLTSHIAPYQHPFFNLRIPSPLPFLSANLPFNIKHKTAIESRTKPNAGNTSPQKSHCLSPATLYNDLTHVSIVKNCNTLHIPYRPAFLVQLKI